MIHHSNEYNIDITAQNINKYTALQYIFDADVKYIAFGNDHNDIFMLQHASSGYIIGPSEAYTHAILKLDKIKHINNNTQAICKVLKSYKYITKVSNLPYSIRVLLESLLRQEDDFVITDDHIKALSQFGKDGNEGEVPLNLLVLFYKISQVYQP